jgi:hypothetical protein
VGKTFITILGIPSARNDRPNPRIALVIICCVCIRSKTTVRCDEAKTEFQVFRRGFRASWINDRVEDPVKLDDIFPAAIENTVIPVLLAKLHIIEESQLAKEVAKLDWSVARFQIDVLRSKEAFSCCVTK